MIIPKRNIENFHRMIEYNDLYIKGKTNTDYANQLYKKIKEQSKIIQLLTEANIN